MNSSKQQIAPSAQPDSRDTKPAGKRPSRVNEGLRRTAGVKAQQALVRPPQAQRPPKGEEANQLVKAIDPKERAKILARRGPALTNLEDLLSYAAFDHNVTHTEAVKAVSILEKTRGGSVERMVMMQDLHRRNPEFLKRLFENLEPKDRTEAWRTTLVWVALFGGQQEISCLLRETPEAAGVSRGKDKATPAEVELLVSKLDRAALTPLARAGGQTTENVDAWLEMAKSAKVKGIKHHFDIIKHEASAQLKQDQALAESSESMMKGATPADAAMKRSVNTIRDLMSYGTFDIEITDAEALKGYKLLAGLGSPEAVRKVVYQLDKGPWMDRFIDNLSPEDRWAEPRTFLSLLSARTPAKNIRFAEELLSYSSNDIEILDEEAKLAFAIVKALPQDQQAEFRALDDGKWWKRMHEELGAEAQVGSGASIYSNADEAKGLKASFGEACATMPQAQLKQQAEMLFRMGEVDFVERTLMGVGLDTSEEHASLFASYGLATSSTPRDAQKWARWEQNVPQQPDSFDPGDFLASIDSVLNPAHTGLLNNTLDLQTIMPGGGTSGLVLAARKEGDTKQNVVGLSTNPKTGEITFTTSSLAIAAVNRLSDGLSFQSGPVTLTDLRVVVRWGSEKGEPRLLIEVGGLHIADLSMVSASAMTSIGAVELGGFRLETIPLRATPPSNELVVVGQLTDEVTTTFQDMLAGVDFSEPEPGAVAESLGASLMGERRANISCDNLSIRDYSTSAGDYIGAVDVKGITLNVDHELVTDGVREEIAALEAIAEPTRTQTNQLMMTRGRLAALEVDERRFKELQAKPDKALQPHERELLGALRNELTVVKAQVNVDSAALGDVDMAGTKLVSAKARGISASMKTQKAAPGTHGGAGRNQRMEATVNVDHFEAEELVQEGTSRLQAFQGRVAELKAKLESNRGTGADAALYKTLSEETDGIQAKVARRNELKLNREPTAAEQAELEQLGQELLWWETKTGGRKIARLAVSNVSGGYNAQSNTMLMRVGQSHIQGLEQDGVKVADISSTDTRIGLDLKGTMKTSLNSDASLTEQLTRLDVRSGALDVKGLELSSEKASDALTAEKRALELKKDLTPAKMTDCDEQRLAAINDRLLPKAKAADKRLTELRSMKRERPDEFGPKQNAELKSLQGFDATIKRVATIQATNATLGLDAQRGRITVGVKGKADKLGIDVKGIEQARIVEGEEVTDARTRRVSAKNLRGGVASAPKGPRAANDDPGLPDFLKIAQGKASLAAAVDAEGFKLQDHEEGTEGEAGHRKIKELSGTLKGTYDSTKGNGSLTVDAKQVGLKGFKARAASKIESAYSARLALQERLQQGKEPSAKERKELEALNEQIETYKTLLGEFKSAKARKAKRKLGRRLKHWTKEVETTIKGLDLKGIRGTVTGLGNPLAENYNLNNQDVGIAPGGTIAGLNLTGMRHGNNRIGQLNLNQMRINRAAHLLDPTKRHFNMSAASGSGKGVRAGAFGLHRGKFRGMNLNLLGNSMSANFRAASGAGIYYGGTSVGMAAASGFKFGMTNMGTERQSVSGSAASLRTKGVKHRGKAMKAALKKMSGKRARFSISPGGFNFSLKTFNLEGFNFVTAGKSGPSEYSLEKLTGDSKKKKGQGLEVSKSKKKGLSVKAEHAEANNILGTGIGDDGRTVEIEKVVVDGMEATLGEDGSVQLLVDNADVLNGRWDDGKGNQSAFSGRLAGKGAPKTPPGNDGKGKQPTKGTPEKGTPETRAKISLSADGQFTASAAQIEVFEVDINEDTLKATLRLGIINDAKFETDPQSNANGFTASASAVLAQDAHAEIIDPKTGKPTTIGGKEASATGLKLDWDGHRGMLSGSAQTASLDGVNLLSGAPADQSGLKLDHAGLLGATFQADVANGVYGGTADQAVINGIQHKGPDGETNLGNILAMGASGVYDAPSGNFGAYAKLFSANGLAHREGGPKSNVEARLASAQADNLQLTGNAKTGALAMDFTKLALGPGSFRAADGRMSGINGDATRLKAQFGGLLLGDGKQTSSLSRDAKGRLDGDLRGVELDAAKGPDGKALPLFERQSYAPHDPSKPNNFANRDLITQRLLLSDLNKGNGGSDLSLDRVMMQNFDPKMPTAAGSLLQFEGINTGNLAYLSGSGTGPHRDGHRQSLLKANGKVDSAYIAGMGGGRMLAGFKGLKDGNFEVFGSKKAQGLARAIGVADIDSSGGFILLGPANGKGLTALYSHLEDFTTGPISLNYTFGGKRFGSYKEALADYDKRKAAWDNKPPFNMAKDSIDVSALDKAFGKLALSYIYNKDHGVADHALWGREADVSADIKDGTLDGDSFDASGQGAVGASLADVGQGVITVGDDVGLDPLNWTLRTAGLSVPGFTNLHGPKMPTQRDYNAPSGAALNRLRLQEFSLGSNEGGHLGLGRQFKADIQGGWGLNISSGGQTAGNQLGIKGNGLNAKNVRANDGNVKADTVGIGTINVELRNAGTNAPILNGTVEGVTIKNATVGKLPVDMVKGLADTHKRLTEKP